jgi:predicted ATPase/DNA-binding XRE family transcriptional regulator
MEQTSSFGYWLRRRRKALDLTQDELAQRTGWSLGTIKKIESDQRRPSKQLTERLADLLEMGADERAVFLKAARAELAIDKLEIVRPSLETLAAPQRSTNLPAHATPFIGRERELAALRDLIYRDDVRLVTLSGPGGTGKTRLGLQVAADVLDRFEHSVWFVNLAPIDDPNLVSATIAQALGVHQVGEQPIGELLKIHLREKRILLLLDNFEHVVEAAPFVSQLLAFAPGLKVMATSRTILRLSGEYEFAVPTMGLPPRLDQTTSTVQPPSSSMLEQYESIRLFVERAQGAKTDFALAAENADTVAEICRRLDGLPLAIKLAAARIKLFSPRALLARLDGRLALLTGGPRDMPARQQTIRDTIDWSYNLLDESEKTLFARLAVFVGGWTIEAAEAVSDLRFGTETEQSMHRRSNIVQIIDRLTSLVDKSMVRQVEGLGGEPRFVMLETIREYALERLEQSGELDIVKRRHAEYYQALAERWWQEARGYIEVALFDQLEWEHDNLRAALNWSHASEDGASIELRLVAALNHFYMVRGHVVEGWERLKAALLRPSSAPDAVRARALGIVGGVTPHYRGDLVHAKAFIEEGLALAKRLGDTQAVAWQLMSLGTIAGLQGDYQRANELFEQSQALYQSLNDTWGQSVTHFVLGQVAFLQNDLDRADILLQQSLKLCRDSIDTTWARARRLTELGIVVLARSQYGRAWKLFAESLALSRASKNKVDIPMAVIGMAGIAGAEGQLERAAYLLGAAQVLSERFGAYRGLTSELVQEQIRTAISAQIDTARFEAAWTAGGQSTLEQAVEEAVDKAPEGVML